MERLSTTSSTVTLTSVAVHSGGAGEQPEKKPRRLLHFSDGVIEEYSTDEEEDCVYSQSTAVNPKTLPWLPWMWYYMHSAASRTFSVADGCGERLAWLFGITSPKYQYALDEHHRQQIEDKEERERDEREKEAARERRNEGRNHGNIITTVSQQTASLPLSSSDRNIVQGKQTINLAPPAADFPDIGNQSGVISSISNNQSAASIHTSSFGSQSAVRIQIPEASSQSDPNTEMSIFPA